MCSKVEPITNKINIDDIFEAIYTTFTLHIQKNVGKGPRWITDSLIGHIINILKYDPLADSSYTNLPKELDHSKKVCIIFKTLEVMNALDGVY